MGSCFPKLYHANTKAFRKNKNATHIASTVAQNTPEGIPCQKFDSFQKEPRSLPLDLIEPVQASTGEDADVSKLNYN